MDAPVTKEELAEALVIARGMHGRLSWALDVLVRYVEHGVAA